MLFNEKSMKNNEKSMTNQLGKALTNILFMVPKKSKTRSREKNDPQIIIFQVLNKKITTLRHFEKDGHGFGPWFLRFSLLF